MTNQTRKGACHLIPYEVVEQTAIYGGAAGPVTEAWWTELPCQSRELGLDSKNRQWLDPEGGPDRGRPRFTGPAQQRVGFPAEVCR